MSIFHMYYILPSPRWTSSSRRWTPPCPPSCRSHCPAWGTLSDKFDISRHPSHPPPIKCLIVFKVLAQSLQEESEFAELYVVRPVFIWCFWHIFNMMEAHVDCRNGIKELTDSEYITNSLKWGLILLFTFRWGGWVLLTRVTSARERTPFPLESNWDHNLFLFS